MRPGIVFLLLVMAFAASGQVKQRIKPGWRMITAAGYSAGESGTGAVFQLSGGLGFRSMYVGIGAGYDNYEYRSFPVFADWRLRFGSKRLVFVYAMPGYNIPGKFTREVSNFWRQVDDRLDGGLYMDAGLGYRVPLGRIHHINFSAGYIRKRITRNKEYRFMCGDEPCPNDRPETIRLRYNFGLVTAKLSWEFGR